MNMKSSNLILADEAATLTLGATLAESCRGGAIITLAGPLGAGKTTLVRGFLRGMGYTGIVKSPTYTLIEPYSVGNLTILHCDLYRLNDPAAIMELGLLDELGDQHIIALIEWPERGIGVLPPATLAIELVPMVDDARQVTLIYK